MDATTAEVLHAFRRAGCRCILLKGPVLQRELYADGSHRSYGDTDLLVSPADLEASGAVLAQLGFELRLDDRHHQFGPDPHAQSWKRRGATVDLHWRLPGVTAPPERAWTVLTCHTAPIVVGDAAGEAFDRTGIALHVALHAGHHGPVEEKPLADLDRAVHRFAPGLWADAARLATELDALDCFSAGLAQTSAGREVAAALRLPAVRSPRRLLISSGPPPGSLGTLRIAEAAGARARARALRGVLLPAPEYMRAAFGLARRGPAGLVLAYAVRLVARTWQLPAAIRAVRAASTRPRQERAREDSNL